MLLSTDMFRKQRNNYRRGYAAVIVVTVLFAASAMVWFGRGRINDLWYSLRAPSVPYEVGPARTTPAVTFGPRATQEPQPLEINLAVPFSSQAPHGNWDLPYQETCEEASAMLVNGFWKGRSFTPDSANVELLDLVEWSKNRFGFYFHTTVEQTAVILREFYGYRDVRVFHDITLKDIKREVSAGRPVIIPAAGRELGNRFFRQPGPVYHMLVVKGFMADGTIITNDVGTRRGHNFVYDEDVFFNAIHDVPMGGDDWPPGVDPAQYILTGGKSMLVVYPN